MPKPFPDRRAEPGQVFTWTGSDNATREVSADVKGVVHVKDVATADHLDTIHLPLTDQATPTGDQARSASDDD